MPLSQVNPSSTFVQRILRTGIFSDHPIYAIDVGASGGIENYLMSLNPYLFVDAFDPLVAEVDRLRDSAPDYVHYWPYFIDAGTAEREHQQNETHSFALSSASKLMELINLNYIEERFNSGKPVVVTKNRTTLDEFLLVKGRPSPSFLKVDTDGMDLEVLLGAKSMLGDANLAAVQIECQFNGPASSTTNTFANIDTLLRRSGFQLIVLEPWVYSRAELPAPFLYDIPAQTTRGCIGFADALYLRDPNISHDLWDFYEDSDTTLATLLVLAVLHGCDDVAASIVVAAQARDIHTHLPYRELLNDLVPENPWGTRSYVDFISKFRISPTRFYASQWSNSSRLHSVPRTVKAKIMKQLRGLL